MSLPKVPQKWDSEADIIVVGGGNTGIPAAITAHDKGASVIVLEASAGMASSLAMIAGGTPFADTDFQKELGIEDSADELYEEAVKVSGGEPELWRAIADRQLEVYYWLKSIGAEPDQIFLAPGHKIARSTRFKGHGAHLCQLLRKAAEDKKIDVRHKHRARQLIADPESGRVIGISAENEGKILNFRAKKAVILATGGFSHNPAILQEYGPQYAQLPPVSPPTHQGDGLKMALALGAATEGIGLSVCPSMPICEETGNIVTGTAWTGLLVNKDAQRWDNEVTDTFDSYTMRHKRLLTFDPTGLHFSITDEAMRQDNPAEGKQPRIKIYEADTIEGLAEKLGLDPKALKATVDEYNSDLDQYGYDRKFGRRRQNNHKDGPPMKLHKPPYQGIRLKICLTSMKGGIKINAKDQVLDQFDNVIPGLYAAGEVAGGLEGIPHHYYTGRMTLQAFVQGRIAGDVAADEAGQ